MSEWNQADVENPISGRYASCEGIKQDVRLDVVTTSVATTF